MKKKSVLFAWTAGMVMFSACSSNDDIMGNGGRNDGNAAQQFVLQVASSGDGLTTRAGRPLESSKAQQDVDNVKLFVCDVSDNVVYTTQISDWETTSTDCSVGGHGKEEVIEIPSDSKLPQGTYTVYAIGYSNNSDYDLDAITDLQKGNKFSENQLISFKNDAGNKIGEEIFAGSLPLTVSQNGFKKPVVLNRQVAGTFAYITDIPYIEGAAKLRLVASQLNTQWVFGNFASVDLANNGSNNGNNVKYVVNGATPSPDNNETVYEINLSDWFNNIEDKDNDNLIDANEWKGDATKYAQGSVFAGSFIIPFEKVDGSNTFKLQMTKTDGTVLREWAVKLPSDQLSNTLTAWNSNTNAFEEVKDYSETANIYSVFRNHLYGIGQRTSDNPTKPGTSDGTNSDIPISLNDKQDLTLRVNDNWEVIHNMEIE
ncbi:MAG: hypothetical protein LUC45_00770 [Paraprevotella sp.]|nr:hypothetical protein [Paraprevotella sp.]